MLKFTPDMDSKRHHPVLIMLLFGLILLGLYVGRYLLTPLMIGVAGWYFINAIGLQLGRIEFRRRKMAIWIRRVLSLIIVVAFFWFIGRMAINSLADFADLAPEYNAKMQELLAKLSRGFDIPTLDEMRSKVDLNRWTSQALNSVLSFASSLFIVIFYVLFLFIEQGIFKRKLDLIFKDDQKRKSFNQILHRIDESMKTYISVKALMSFLVAVCSYIVLISFGVDFAILWAFVAFLLNFIPFVGSFIAILLPTLQAILQFDSLTAILALFIILSAIQVIVGNFLEPKLVGKSLNLSPLVVVLALAFWGSLWGVAGMFLCVPITVALMIILSQFQSTKAFAILLSAGNDPSGDAVNSDDPK